MVNAVVLDARQERGAALAKAKGRQIRHVAGAKYLVPSATGTAGYVVDHEAGNCTCPDHEDRRVRCKHLWAVAYVRHEVALPDGSTLVTEAVRVTYSQDWSAYNRAQTGEGERVRILLRDLCNGIHEAPHGRGRPRVALGDVIYGAALKVYGTKSGRRSASDLRDAEERGLVGRAASYNTLFRRLESADMMPVLEGLLSESGRPLRAIETEFAADATGFATSVYNRWFDYRYGDERPMKVQRYVKLHAAVGTRTHVVTFARVTESNVSDSPMLPALLHGTAAGGFIMAEVSADKGYLSHANLAAIEAAGASPFVAIKSNTTGKGSPAMERMFHHFSANKPDFLAHYHRRSNVEATFGAIKKKFGASVRSKLPIAQYNEVLLKVLCHNLTCLVHAIHELNVDPKFWTPSEVQS
jgi:transposase